MKTRLLAVAPKSTNYAPFYELSVSSSYEDAKEKIIAAEESGVPFDTLDLPIEDEALFWSFLDWMEKRGKKYSFSIHGRISTPKFCSIAEMVRARGFIFNT